MYSGTIGAADLSRCALLGNVQEVVLVNAGLPNRSAAPNGSAIKTLEFAALGSFLLVRQCSSAYLIIMAQPVHLLPGSARSQPAHELPAPAPEDGGPGRSGGQ